MSASICSVCEGVSKSFAGVHALHEVSLAIDAGEIVCLAGENGSGKSTLVKILAGVVTPDAGAIEVDGRTRPVWQPIDAVRAGFEVIYQDFSLFPNLTVAENIAFNDQLSEGRRLVSWRAVRRIAEEGLSMVGVAVPLECAGRGAERRRQAGRGDRPRPRSGRTVDRHGRADHGADRTRGQVAVRYRTSPQGGRRRGDFHQPQAVRDLRHLRAHHRPPQRRQGRGWPGVELRHGFPFATHARSAARAARERARPRTRRRAFAGRGARAATGRFQDVSFSLHAGEVLGVTGLLGSGRTALGQGAVRPRSGGSRVGSSSADAPRASPRRSTRSGSASATSPPTGSPRGCSCRSRSRATSWSAASIG